MFRHKSEFLFLFAPLLCALAGAPATAKAEQASPAVGVGTPEAVQLKVDVVLSRFMGAKKVSAQTYTLMVPAPPAPASTRDNPVVPPQGQSTSLRVGVNAFTGRNSSSIGDDGKTSTRPEYQYVGTDVDCRADYKSPGLYRVNLNLTDSSLMSPVNADAPLASVAAGVRRFSASNTLSVRDTQTVQFSAGTDPISGETIRVDVTVNAMK